MISKLKISYELITISLAIVYFILSLICFITDDNYEMAYLNMNTGLLLYIIANKIEYKEIVDKKESEE